MKLSQALKIKNRLAGEIAQQQQILQRENARRNDSVSTVDRSAVYTRILELSKDLGDLKAKIAKANIGVYANLERMAEMKGHVAFLTGLQKREGEEVQFIGRDQEKLVYKWDSFINQTACDEKVAALQKQIGALQDAVDTYNATTDV
jgi:hypothetical protein